MEGILMMEVNIAVACTLISTIIAIMVYWNNKKKEETMTATRDVENNTSVKEELKYISRGIEDIKYDTKTLAGSMNAMNERLARAEEAIKNVEKEVENIKYLNSK